MKPIILYIALVVFTFGVMTGVLVSGKPEPILITETIHMCQGETHGALVP